MNTHFRFWSLAVLLISLLASTARAQMSNSNNAVVPYKSVTPLEESTLERTIIVASRHITQARSDIQRKDVDKRPK